MKDFNIKIIEVNKATSRLHVSMYTIAKIKIAISRSLQ